MLTHTPNFGATVPARPARHQHHRTEDSKTVSEPDLQKELANYIHQTLFQVNESLQVFLQYGGNDSRTLRSCAYIAFRLPIAAYVISANRQTLEEIEFPPEEGEYIDAVIQAREDWPEEARDLLKAATVQEREYSRHPAFKLWQSSMSDASQAIQDDKHKKAKNHLNFAIKLSHHLGALREAFTHIGWGCAAVKAKTINREKDGSNFLRTIELAEQALSEQHPLLAQAYHNIGWYKVQTHDWVAAESYLGKALEIAERNPKDELPGLILFLLLQVYNNLGKADKAAQALARLKEFDPLVGCAGCGTQWNRFEH